MDLSTKKVPGMGAGVCVSAGILQGPVVGFPLVWPRFNMMPVIVCENMYKNKYFFFGGGGIFSLCFFILYSALLHRPPLRFHCADGCWERTPGPLQLVHWQLDALTTRLDLIHIMLDLIRTRLDLIRSRLDLIRTRLDLIRTRLDLIRTRLDLIR
jgi:hypothetical protein